MDLDRDRGIPVYSESALVKRQLGAEFAVVTSEVRPSGTLKFF